MCSFLRTYKCHFTFNFQLQIASWKISWPSSLLCYPPTMQRWWAFSRMSRSWRRATARKCSPPARCSIKKMFFDWRTSQYKNYAIAVTPAPHLGGAQPKGQDHHFSNFSLILWPVVKCQCPPAKSGPSQHQVLTLLEFSKLLVTSD